MQRENEIDAPVDVPPRAGKPMSTMMIVGLAAVAALVLGILFYALSPYVMSEAIDAEELPGVTEPE